MSPPSKFPPPGFNPNTTPPKKRGEIHRIEIQMNNPKAWYDRAGSLYQLQRYEEAIASYDKAIAIQPDYPDAWNNRGMALKMLQRYDQAVASFDRAVAIEPNYHRAWNNRGNCLSSMGRYEAAIVSYDRALALHPEGYELWHNKGETLAFLHRYEAAIACYRRALKIQPQSRETRALLDIALAQLTPPPPAPVVMESSVAQNSRLQACEAMVARYPQDAQAWADRGHALFELGAFQEAIASYDRAIALQPADATVWKYRARSLKRLHRYEAAIDSYEKALELQPQPPQRNRTEVLSPPPPPTPGQHRPSPRIRSFLYRVWQRLRRIGQGFHRWFRR